MLNLAAGAALNGKKRNFLVGAVGIRSDGTLVAAVNSIVQVPTPSAHAESRLCRKLDYGATVYVARITKTGDIALSKPCPRCEGALRAHGVKKVYYTIGNTEHGVMDL
jgi:tRNA(Arg) A34 adenosine deaminase TadA